MLVTLNEIMNMAREQDCGVGAFNTPNLECLNAVLDLDRVKVISERTGLPLVMHGGSGVSDEDYRVAIHNGIRKINYYSYMAKAGVSAVQQMLDAGDVTYFHDLALAAQKAMEENAKRAMKVFAGL